MTQGDIEMRLEFLRDASRLKDVLRRTYTRSGQIESTAEHTWALCLLVMTFADQLPGLDLLKLMKMCVLHDLGEAIHGDVPAISQTDPAAKSAQEREDLLTIMMPLPETVRNDFLLLWDEYENASSPEARIAKAFDKIETISQHNGGLNPDTFDHTFNLTYGRKYTDTSELTRRIRNVLDRETRCNMARPRSELTS